MVNPGLIKLMLQNKGVFLKDDLRDEVIAGYNCFDVKMGKIFLYIRADQVNVKIPVYTVVSNKRDAYEIQQANGQYFIDMDGMRVDAGFYPQKEVYQKLIGARLAGDIVRVKADDHLAITINHYCKYFADGQQCKFCNIHKWPTQTHSTLQEIIEAAYLYQEQGEIKHLSITGGTGHGADKGLLKMIQFIIKLRDRGVSLPIAVEFEPIHNKEWLCTLASLGVKTISCNIELLGDIPRAQLMPGKGQIPFETYLKTWQDCIDVFGENQVYTNILLTAADEAGQFIPRAKEIIDAGVIPSIGMMLEQKGAEIKIQLPELSTQISYFTEVVQRLKKVGLNPLKAKAGCAKNGGYSPINEFYTYNNKRR